MAEPQPTLPPVTDAAAPRSASISACTHHDDLSAGSSGKSAKGVTGASGDQQLFTTEPCDDVLPLAVPPEKPAKLSKRVSQWLAGFFRFVGPGFVMTIAFLDPGNLAADVNQGVLGGYTLMWVTLYSTLMVCCFLFWGGVGCDFCVRMFLICVFIHTTDTPMRIHASTSAYVVHILYLNTHRHG